MLLSSLSGGKNLCLQPKLLEAELVLAVCVLLDEQLAPLELVDEIGLLVQGIVLWLGVCARHFGVARLYLFVFKNNK